MNENPLLNPYTSPQTPPESLREPLFPTSKGLRICANGIMVIGWVQIFIGVVACIVLPIVFVFEIGARYRSSLPSWAIVLELLSLPIYFARTLYMIRGAKHLRAGTNYRAAYAAALLAALGILFPFSPYEVPFGITALVLLRQAKNKTIFETHSASSAAQEPISTASEST